MEGSHCLFVCCRLYIAYIHMYKSTQYLRGRYLSDRLPLKVTELGSACVSRSNLNGVEIVNGM